MKKIVSVLIASLIFISSLFSVNAFATTDTFTLKEDESKIIQITIPENGGYSVSITYQALKGRNVSPRIAVSWDKAYSDNESEVYDLPRSWTDVREGDRFKQDDYGNELSPTPIRSHSARGI